MMLLKFPLSKITFVFVLGILFAFYGTPDPIIVFTILLVLFFFLLLFYHLAKKDLIQKNYFGIITSLLCFCIGCTTQIIHTDSYDTRHYIHQTKTHTNSSLLKVIIIERLKSGIHTQRYIASVQEINTIESTGKLVLVIREDSIGSFASLAIGSNLVIKGIIVPHKKPYNPSQFDYGKYLKNKSILAQIYVNSNAIKINNILQKDIFYYADFIRYRIIHNLRKRGFNEAELNVAVALILGQQQDIAPEIVRDYRYAGAVHILAVSGLHVGFILLFINFILKPLPNSKTGLLLKLIVILLSLWGFAVIAGLSASVVRSAAMFSFVAIGMHLKRHTNIYHTLTVSIFIILLFKPSFLFDVGFQLSYIALFFIVWFQPLLSKMIMPKKKLTRYFWDILTVSFAAQIGTLPLSLYYFHQFPCLFFVTNMIVIPFLTIILAVGVVVMLLAAFEWVPLLPFKILEYNIYMLNKIIKWIASFEDFIIKDIPFNVYMLISSYLVIISFIIWLKTTDNYRKLILSLGYLIIFQITCLGTKWKHEKMEEWIVFNMIKKTLITKREGKEVTTYCNDRLIQNNLNLKSYLLDNFSSLKQQENLNNLYYFNKKKILIVDNTGIYPRNIKVDILLLIQSPKINLDRMIQTIRPKLIIADASNYKSYVDLWNETCLQQKTPFHSTAEKGFYSM